MSRAPNGRLAPPGVRAPGAVDAPRHRRPASPIDHPRRPARGAATGAGRPGPRSGLPPWSPRRVRDRSDAHGERAAAVSRFALNEVAHGGASARAEPGNPHIALRFRRNVLRPGENHRVTCATREYRVRARRRSRPPSLGAGVAGRSAGLSPRAAVHGPFRLAAGEILRGPAVRFGDAPGPDAVCPCFPGGGGEVLFRAGGLATEERGVAADRPPALPEPLERRTGPDDIAADFLAEARPLSPVGSRWRSRGNRASRGRRRSRERGCRRCPRRHPHSRNRPGSGLSSG